MKQWRRLFFNEIRGRGGNFRFKGYIRLSGQLYFFTFVALHTIYDIKPQENFAQK